MRPATLLVSLPLVAAYPWAMEVSDQMAKRQDVPVRDPTFVSGRPNIGGFAGPPAPFDAEAQYVDVRPGTEHEFRPPGTGDRRGQCPGLNAAANSGFIPRNGILNIADTVTGLAEAFNMAPDLSLFLAVYSVAVSGDFITQRWSIGGSFPGGLGLLGQPRGLLGTHNIYEGDASATRGDAYLNNGFVNVFQMRSWEHLYALQTESYGIDDIARQNEYSRSWSIRNNPYYFAGAFSGIVVTPAAHNFIINFMSNHSAENNGGFLSRDVLKSFFAVEGEPGSFTQTPGHERIPENWYKRAAANAYSIPAAVGDVQTNNLMYPGLVGVGGNTGTVDSYTGVDLGDLTGGVFNAATLLEGDNLACYALQASQAAIVDAVSGIVSDLGALLRFVTDQLGPLGESLQCPPLAEFDNGLFNPFPGARR